MAVKASDILKLALTSILGGAVSTRAVGGLLHGARASDVLKGAALTYPGLTSTFDYGVVYAPNPGGYANNNASVDRYLAEDGALAQTLAEHNEGVRRGDEKSLSSWWPNEDVRPRRDFHPSSSAVSGVRINPDNTVSVRFGGKGKWYTYRGGTNPREASEVAKSLLTAPSIGRALPRNGKLRHNGKSDRAGVPDANIGWWGRKYAI